MRKVLMAVAVVLCTGVAMADIVISMTPDDGDIPVSTASNPCPPPANYRYISVGGSMSGFNMYDGTWTVDVFVVNLDNENQYDSLDNAVYMQACAPTFGTSVNVPWGIVGANLSITANLKRNGSLQATKTIYGTAVTE